MDEKIIVSLTSYGDRLNNLPIVLDTVFSQTILPNEVMLNLAYEEILPKTVEEYLKNHNVKINRVPDTKVYKKIIPTLSKYPDDCIICIDDDWLYPAQMVEDFVNVHKKFPHNPISGNRVILWGMQCHCGCASLVKKEYFGVYFEHFDESLFSECPSSDIVYSYFAAKNGTPYIRTQHEYFWNMNPIQCKDGYSKSCPNGIELSYNYLTEHFGSIESVIENYFLLRFDGDIGEIIRDIEQKYRTMESDNLLLSHNYSSVLYSSAFKLGCFLLKPVYWIKKMWMHFSTHY